MPEAKKVVSKPIEQATAHVMEFLNTVGSVYVWRECLTNTGHVVRWTNWDPVKRQQFQKKLIAAVTTESVRQAISRAAAYSPDVPFNRKRGAVYAIMCIGWHIFYTGMDGAE